MSRTAEPTSPASSFKSLFISAIICYRKDLNGDAGRGGGTFGSPRLFVVFISLLIYANSFIHVCNLAAG